MGQFTFNQRRLKWKWVRTAYSCVMRFVASTCEITGRYSCLILSLFSPLLWDSDTISYLITFFSWVRQIGLSCWLYSEMDLVYQRIKQGASGGCHHSLSFTTYSDAAFTCQQVNGGIQRYLLCMPLCLVILQTGAFHFHEERYTNMHYVSLYVLSLHIRWSSERDAPAYCRSYNVQKASHARQYSQDSPRVYQNVDSGFSRS